MSEVRCVPLWIPATFVLVVSLFGVSCRPEDPAAGPEVVSEAPFSVVVGTQAIGPKYQFTGQPMLVEMAKAIQDLGGDTLKVSVSPRYHRNYRIERDPAIGSVTDLVSKEPSFKAVFDMPFRNIMFWLYPFADKFRQFRTGTLAEEEAEQMYREIYDLTAYLLTTYSGSGKSFYIGNWEGDWHTLKNYDAKADPDPKVLEVMRQWLLLREKAISDARRDTPHDKVHVYFYVEINQVAKAMDGDRPAIVNRVLPHIRADFVSYSSYDVTNEAMKTGGEEGRKRVFAALDYIEKHLPPGDIPGKRVMIGEYGLPQQAVTDPELQRDQTRELMRWGLEWGCPFILYWQLYCNEINEGSGEHRGFWLIDDKGVKQPVWYLHHDFLSKANGYVADYQRRNGKLPCQNEFCQAAETWLEIPSSPSSPNSGH